MVESSLVLWGDRIISTSRGKPAEVEFDFEAIWRYRGLSVDIFRQRELTWLHVHPIGYGTQASSMDQHCAEGLNMALGSLGWFGILCFRTPDPDDVHGDISWYRFVNGKLRLEERQLYRGPNAVCKDTMDITDWFRKDLHIPYMLKGIALAKV